MTAVGEMQVVIASGNGQASPATVAPFPAQVGVGKGVKEIGDPAMEADECAVNKLQALVAVRTLIYCFHFSSLREWFVNLPSPVQTGVALAFFFNSRLFQQSNAAN